MIVWTTNFAHGIPVATAPTPRHPAESQIPAAKRVGAGICDFGSGNLQSYKDAAIRRVTMVCWRFYVSNPMRPFDAIIFDMDGLLLDTERLAMAVFNETCETFGVGPQPDLYRQCIGTNEMLTRDILRHGLPDHVDLDAFRRMWSRKYEEGISRGPLPVKEGVADLLVHIAQLRLPAAVATSTGTERARRKLAGVGLLDKFQAVVGGDQVRHSKPDPEIYITTADALGVPPRRCLALEDSPNGVRAAVAAGMTVIQIPDLVEPTPDLLQLGHRVLKSLTEVPRHVGSHAQM